MASSFSLPLLEPRLLHKSTFLGQTLLSYNTPSSIPRTPSTFALKPAAKFDLYKIMGGRGLCNGEAGLERELARTVDQATPSDTTGDQKKSAQSKVEGIPEDGFEKELLGLTGGFPGGEKGLKKFIEKNPPPAKYSTGGLTVAELVKKPKAPELPLLMPGMIAIVKNPNSPFYMYCGIVQRITDGKAGVLFEGGNWDRLITFRLDELERREKGPPMVNPKSVVLEPFLESEKEAKTKA
ncbi:hypothetical protein NMG60_11030550 [Bertholletia excelsa]